MPRPRNAIRTKDFHVMLPAEEFDRLDFYLWSDAEQRIPHAAKAKWVTERIREFFGSERLDLGLYFPEMPPGSIVAGSPSTIRALRAALEAQ